VHHPLSRAASSLSARSATKLVAILVTAWCGVGAIAAGCKAGTSTNDSGAATGGTTGTTGGAGGTGGGGTMGAGGAGSGGNPGLGGSTSSSGGATGSGGTSSSGGATGSGGTSSSGGATGSGGTSSGGNGGSTGTGGASGAAGRGGVGGAAAGSGAAGAAGAGGQTTACTGRTYKLCEDFESGTVGGLPTGWTAYDGYGNDAATGIGLAKDQVHSGAMALKSDSMVPGEERIQKSLAALGPTATTHWGRIFYKVQSPAPSPSSGNYFHTTFVALEGTTENRVVDSVEQSNGTHQWIFNLPDDSCCTGSDYDWTFDASWHCAEWYVDVTTESYRFFTDSTEVTSLAFTKNAAAKMSSYTALVLGAIFYQTPPSPFVLWLDDLAIDDAQIGCQ
jgi:hypothetical protein